MNNSTTLVRRQPGSIRLHGPEAFAAMRKAGRLTAEALDMLVPMV
ncbi:MAG: type I methionyl aminopeptidase, partial [Methylobacterium sp.]|nr:type I methionyl aminopeptidase [Methylobacterium sp.]